MNKLMSLALSSVLLLGAIACENNAKTSSDAPGSTTVKPSDLDQEEAQGNQEDASSRIRRDQLNADIRAREQRNNAGGNEYERADSDLASEVRSKLEANLPASKLTIDAKNGEVTVSGIVVSQQQLDKIEPLAKEIKGVKNVVVKAALDRAAEP